MLMLTGGTLRRVKTGDKSPKDYSVADNGLHVLDVCD